MKDIGFTNDGKRLVEMSEEEHKELVRLCEAVEGKTGLPYFDRPDDRYKIDFDFSRVFMVIRAYYLHRFKINELQELVNAVREALG